MKKIAGIDGSKGGWVCVSGYKNNYSELEFEKFKNFNDILSKNFKLILVDIPIHENESGCMDAMMKRHPLRQYMKTRMRKL